MIISMKTQTKAFLGVGFLLGLSVIANMTMLYFSIVSYDGLVEENYYNKGLNYQNQIDREKLQEKLGWSASFTHTNKTYTVIARKVNNTPLEKASVSLNFFRPSQSGFDQKIFLTEISPGIYQVNAKMDLKGYWNITTEIRKHNSIWKKKEKLIIK